MSTQHRPGPVKTTLHILSICFITVMHTFTLKTSSQSGWQQDPDKECVYVWKINTRRVCEALKHLYGLKKLASIAGARKIQLCVCMHVWRTATDVGSKNQHTKKGLGTTHLNTCMLSQKSGPYVTTYEQITNRHDWLFINNKLTNVLPLKYKYVILELYKPFYVLCCVVATCRLTEILTTQ